MVEQHSEGVKRKAERVEVEPSKPKKKSSGLRFDDDKVFNFTGPPSLSVTLRVSAINYLKPAIDRAKWYLP